MGHEPPAVNLRELLQRIAPAEALGIHILDIDIGGSQCRPENGIYAGDPRRGSSGVLCSTSVRPGRSCRAAAGGWATEERFRITPVSSRPLCLGPASFPSNAPHGRSETILGTFARGIGKPGHVPARRLLRLKAPVSRVGQSGLTNGWEDPWPGFPLGTASQAARTDFR
jgi:hypothetical protein